MRIYVIFLGYIAVTGLAAAMFLLGYEVRRPTQKIEVGAPAIESFINEAGQVGVYAEAIHVTAVQRKCWGSRVFFTARLLGRSASNYRVDVAKDGRVIPGTGISITGGETVGNNPESESAEDCSV